MAAELQSPRQNSTTWQIPGWEIWIEEQFRLLALVLWVFLVIVPHPVAGSDLVYSDTDWNVRLKDTCGQPNPDAVKWIKFGEDNKLQFTLNPGDSGLCSTDNRRRHGAAYWERSELTQLPALPLGSKHRIEVEVTILEGFTAARESFFQIHGWNQRCTGSYPPLMMKFHKGELRVEALKGASALRTGKHRNVLRQKVEVKDLYGKPAKLRLDIDTTTKPGRFSFWLGTKRLIKNAQLDFAPCATPYLKLGIYRPGGRTKTSSKILFDDIQIKSVK